MHGITRLVLSRLAADGLLERLAHGVYKDTGSPGDKFEHMRAAWLSTDPKCLAHERRRDRVDEVVFAGASAARLHDIGNLWDPRFEFVTAKRRQSQRPDIRYRLRALDSQDVTSVEGLPVMTIERTIADLVEEVGDLSLVADALRDAWLKGDLNTTRLSALLGHVADRGGFKKGDGAAMLDRLMEIAGVDANSLARRLEASPTYGTLAAVARTVINVG